MGSSNLSAVVAAALPHPTRFQLAWSLTAGKTPLYVWRALPPSEGYVAMGMVCTNTEEAPPLSALHCVPRSWVKPAREPPTLIWENAGVGGRRGGLYVVNSLGLLEASTGGLPPQECWDLARDHFQVCVQDLWQPQAQQQQHGGGAGGGGGGAGGGPAGATGISSLSSTGRSDAYYEPPSLGSVGVPSASAANPPPVPPRGGAGAPPQVPMRPATAAVGVQAASVLRGAGNALMKGEGSGGEGVKKDL